MRCWRAPPVIVILLITIHHWLRSAQQLKTCYGHDVHVCTCTQNCGHTARSDTTTVCLHSSALNLAFLTAITGDVGIKSYHRGLLLFASDIDGLRCCKIQSIIGNLGMTFCVDYSSSSCSKASSGWRSSVYVCHVRVCRCRCVHPIVYA